MKPHPQWLAESEALEWATKFFREYADGIKKQGSWALTKRVVSTAELTADDGLIEKLRNAALFKGDMTAIKLLCDMAAERIKKGKALSGALQKFAHHFLRHPFMKWQLADGAMVVGEKIKSKPGPMWGELLFRDQAIFIAMSHIVENWGFAATRSKHQRERGTCAALIVQQAIENGAALRVGEDTISGIWDSNIENHPASEKIPEIKWDQSRG